MKISIDMDGTLWSHMGFFRAFMKAMQAAGHQVGILTGHPERIRGDDIALMLSRGFPRPDFWIGKPDGSGEHGGDFKPRMMREHGIDYHFDDADFGSPETHAKFEASGLWERVFKVRHREPTSTHFE